MSKEQTLERATHLHEEMLMFYEQEYMPEDDTLHDWIDRLKLVIDALVDNHESSSEAMEAAMFRWIRDNCEVEHQNWQYLPDDPMVVSLAERVSSAMQAQANDAEVQP